VTAALVLAWFGPVLFTGKLFITDNYLGAFFLPPQPWSDLLHSGFPLYADLNFGNCYPIRVLFAAIAGVVGRASSYNLFVCAAYVIAAIGTLVYMRRLTDSTAAAVLSGIAFAFSGFMQAHVGHETMTHSAAWLPWLLWSTHRVIEDGRWRDAAWLALAAAAMYLANHPEIFLQVALLAGAYALCLGARRPWPARRFGMLAAGWLACAALVAWQLAASAEYAYLSQRVATARVLTLHGALPVDQVAQFALPWVFGGMYPSALSPQANFGYEMTTEIAAFVAAPVFILAVLGAIATLARRVTRFWLAAALIGFVLALGPQTLLGEALFFAPGFRLFNIPGRYMLTVHFAFSVLAGIGASAVLARWPVRARGTCVWIVGLLPTAFAVASYPLIVRKAAAAGVTLPPAWGNIAVVAPVGIALAAAACITLAARLPQRAGVALIFAVTLAACGYFGWNTPWRIASGPAEAMLDPPPVVKSLRELARQRPGRVLAADGWLGPLGVGPNQSMLFDLPNISGYGPLLPRAYAEFTHLTNAGWIRPDVFDPEAKALDLLSARWIFPHARTATVTDASGLTWNPTPLGQAVGGNCSGSPLPRTASYALGEPANVRGIALVSTLGCALDIPQGTVVAYAVLHRRDGQGELRVPLHAGVETAEWTADCRAPPGFEPKHRAATPFDSTRLPNAGPDCVGHRYLARIPLAPAEVDGVRIEWAMPETSHPKAQLQIQHLTLIADGAGAVTLDRTDAAFADARRWKAHRLPSGHVVQENLRAQPLAWLASGVRRVKDEQEAIAIGITGRLPGGAPFDAGTAVLTGEAGPRVREADPTRAGLAQVRRWDNGDVEIEVEAASPSIVIVSQRYYPGWRATVDGVRAPVLKVDGVLQGVEVGAGRHRVTLEFAPWQLRWLSWLSLLALAGIVLAIARRPGKLPTTK
jgi:hypothetical protein